ncbi:hypothetical protein [Kibdelosporangium philippinense]
MCSTSVLRFAVPISSTASEMDARFAERAGRALKRSVMELGGYTRW